MQLEKKITTGNIVSWAMILVGLVAGYVKLETAVAQNVKDVAAATALAAKVEQSLRDLDAVRASQINQITTDMAVTKVIVGQMDMTMGKMDKKIDEVLARTK